MYHLLYLKNSVFNRLFLYFQDYFSDASKPTARNLFLLVISILTLDIFRSVRFAHTHVISRLSGTSLNAFYYTLKTDAYDHSVWNDVTVSKAVRAVPRPLEGQPIFLSIDDTMAEKFGRHFELCSKIIRSCRPQWLQLPQWILHGQPPAFFPGIPGWENPLPFCSGGLPALG